MTTNDELDDFFKKKDRKAKKPTKQAALLTNNEELLKQLVIVTSATSAFKENADFDDEEDDEGNLAAHNNHTRHQPQQQQQQQPRHPDEPMIRVDDENSTVLTKSHSVKKTSSDKTSSSKHPVQDNTNITPGINNTQDEWEEFDNSSAAYQQLRMKFSRGDPSQFNDDEGEEEGEFFDDGTHQIIQNEDTTDMPGNDEQPMRTGRRRDQQKEKPAWKIDQLNQQTSSVPLATEPNVSSPTNPIEEAPPAAPKPASSSSSSSGAYRPPQMRNSSSSSSSVTVVSGGENLAGQRSTKKKEPNLASVEEFPTLGAAVNKK